MNKLTKLMLAAAATVVLAIPAYAVDLSMGVSGSANARFLMGSKKASTTAKAESYSEHDTTGNSVTVSFTGADEEAGKSVTYSISLGQDDGSFTENHALSGSTTLGDWTGSASTSVKKRVGAATDADDSDDAAGGSKGDTQVTLTDGKMTFKLGTAAHLGSAKKAGANEFYNTISTDEELGVGARVGAFDGFSFGYQVDDATSVTVALQQEADQKILGKDRFKDNRTTSGTDVLRNSKWADTAKFNTNSFGFAVATNAGGADIAFTYASGSMAPNATKATTYSGYSVGMNTMGLGVSVPVGAMTIAFSYSTYARDIKCGTANDFWCQGGDNASVAGYKTNKTSDTAMLLALDGVAGDLGWTVTYQSDASTATSDGTAVKSDSNGIDIGLKQAIGPVTLNYGLTTLLSKNSGGSATGKSTMIYGGKLTYAF